MIIEKKKPAPDRPRYVVLVQCFHQEMADGSLLDLVKVELYDNDPKNALERAKKIVDRKFYRVAQIIEKLPDEE